MTNSEALLTLVDDINKAFWHLDYEEEDFEVAKVCDGDLKLLDKAVKRFKTTIWENQLDQCHKVLSIPNKNGLLQYYKQKQTFFPIMKKVTKSAKDLRLSKILDYLTDLGWEYTCGCMTRSGMQTYDELMQYIGVLDSNEHWNEDCYKDKCCDH